MAKGGAELIALHLGRGHLRPRLGGALAREAAVGLQERGHGAEGQADPGPAPGQRLGWALRRRPLVGLDAVLIATVGLPAQDKQGVVGHLHPLGVALSLVLEDHDPRSPDAEVDHGAAPLDVEGLVGVHPDVAVAVGVELDQGVVERLAQPRLHRFTQGVHRGRPRGERRLLVGGVAIDGGAARLHGGLDGHTARDGAAAVHHVLPVDLRHQIVKGSGRQRLGEHAVEHLAVPGAEVQPIHAPAGEQVGAALYRAVPPPHKVQAPLEPVGRRGPHGVGHHHDLVAVEEGVGGGGLHADVGHQPREVDPLDAEGLEPLVQLGVGEGGVAILDDLPVLGMDQGLDGAPQGRAGRSRPAARPPSVAAGEVVVIHRDLSAARRRLRP